MEWNVGGIKDAKALTQELQELSLRYRKTWGWEARLDLVSQIQKVLMALNVVIDEGPRR